MGGRLKIWGKSGHSVEKKLVENQCQVEFERSYKAVLVLIYS